MAHYQHLLLNWVATQPGLTGAVIMAAGLLSAFHGYRMVRFLLVLYCGGLGYAGGLGVAALTHLPAMPLTALGGLAGGAAALAWPGPATVVASGATWALLGGYFAGQLGLKGAPVWIALGLCGPAGAVLALLCRRTMTVLLTSLQGTALIIVGFVGVASTVLPVVGRTFRSWAQDHSLVVPVLLVMLVTTAYSYQANDRRGDMCTGGQVAEQRPSRRAPKGAAKRDLS